MVPLGRKEPVPAIEGAVGICPQAVHKVKVRAKGRKGVQRTSYEGGKDAVVFQPCGPACQGSIILSKSQRNKSLSSSIQSIKLPI